MARRAPTLFSRAGAVAAARRLAIEALARLARQVERLAMVVEPAAQRLPLRGEASPLDVLPRGSSHEGRERGGSPWPAQDAAAAGSTVEAAPTVAEPATAPTPTRHDDPTPTIAEPAASSSSIESARPLGLVTAADPGPALALVDHLRARIDPRIADLRRAASEEGAHDPVDALRRLRVASRRLRAFARLFAAVLGSKRAKQLNRRLRRVTRGLGPTRQWDGLLASLRTEHVRADPLSRAALEHVIAYVESERAASLEDVDEALRKADLAALADAIEDELDRVCGRILRLGDDLRPQLGAWLEPVLARAFDDRPSHDDAEDIAALHEIRTRAKQLRYAIELLRPVLGDAYRPLHRPAKALQRALGVHHERALLRELLRDRAGPLAALGLTTLAGALETISDHVLVQRRAAYEIARPKLGRFTRAEYVPLLDAQLGTTLSALPSRGGEDDQDRAGVG